MFRLPVSFVRLDEYRNESQRTQGGLRGKWRRGQPPEYQQSLLHFNDSAQLLSCRSQLEGQAWEEVRCFYRDGLLIKRSFSAHYGEREVYREENHIYNEHKLLVEKTLREEDNLKQRVLYRYDEDFRLLREEDLQRTKIYLYNDAGLCSEEQIHVGEEHTKSLRHSYDDNGRLRELWEESPVGQVCRLHKYTYNKQNLFSAYQLVNQDGLVLTSLEYKYSNFVEEDWLECYTWRLGGRAGKPSYQPVRTCLRSPCLLRDTNEEIERQFLQNVKTLELPEGKYQGQTRVGRMHGRGRLDFFDGSCYIGQFDSGFMHGYGSFYWPDGRIYQGYFDGNQMQGHGNYYLADGSLYQGTFSEGHLLQEQAFYFVPGNSPYSRQNRRKSQLLERRQRDQNLGDSGDGMQGSFKGQGKGSCKGSCKGSRNKQPSRQSEEEFIAAAVLAVQQKFQLEAEQEVAIGKRVEDQRIESGRLQLEQESRRPGQKQQAELELLNQRSQEMQEEKDLPPEGQADKGALSMLGLVQLHRQAAGQEVNQEFSQVASQILGYDEVAGAVRMGGKLAEDERKSDQLAPDFAFAALNLAGPGNEEPLYLNEHDLSQALEEELERELQEEFQVYLRGHDKMNAQTLQYDSGKEEQKGKRGPFTQVW